MITNVTQYLDRQMIDKKDKVAVLDERIQLTFEQLYMQSWIMADKIRELSNERYNEPIVVFCPKGVLEYLSMMGVLYSGNYYVPLDIKMPLKRLQLIIKLLDAKIAISTSDLSIILRESGFEGQIIQGDAIDFESTDRVQKEYRNHIIDTDPAYVLFTSGSTGIPKGVVVSHRAIIDYIEWQCRRFMFDDTTVLGNQAPFYFDASMPDIYTTISVGATLCIIPEKLFLVPNRLIDYINEHQINTLIWVPSALMTLTNKDYFCTKRMEKLRIVMFCGEVMPNKHLNIWRKYYPQVKFINLYGPTEAAYACTYFEVNRNFRDDESLPIGRACENTDILVLNAKNYPAEIGEEGELCIRGSSLANGYFANEEKTEEVFVQNPLNKRYAEKIYRTGDIVKYNGYGELEYVGRKDFQIKHMGYRIELGEIEAAVYGVECMKQCCAIYDDKEEKIVLYCATEKDITEKEIYAFLRERLPRYMLPGRIIMKEELPLNANGKIDRLGLKTKAMN